ncbi:MAG: hypothetical protein ABW185_08000 [Sedimenticola sp.]
MNTSKEARVYGNLSGNKHKYRGKKLYCICRKPEDNREYVGCDGCKEWFHFDCVGYDKHPSKIDLPYYCFMCQIDRSRLDKIESRKGEASGRCEEEDQSRDNEENEKYKFDCEVAKHANEYQESRNEDTVDRVQRQTVIDMLQTECDNINDDDANDDSDTDSINDDDANDDSDDALYKSAMYIEQHNFSEDSSENEDSSSSDIDKAGSATRSENSPDEDNTEDSTDSENSNGSASQETILFKIKLTRKEWNTIKPSENRRCLIGRWTKILFSKFKEVNPSCVLKFTYNRVKKMNSRKERSAYINVKAQCSFTGCASYRFFKKNPPDENRKHVYIEVEQIGCVVHRPNEVRKRNTTGAERAFIAQELKREGVGNWYYRNCAAMDDDVADAGNLNDCKTPNVLYKIASEHNSKGQLHTDVLQEVKLLHDVYKEIDEKDEPNGYIQHFSCNPFATIMYTKKQLELYLEQNSKHNTPLCLDATGSIIQKIPNQNKRIFYYALVMKNPMEHRSAIPIAEMITNDHHSYEIKHFLNKFISDLKKIRNYRYIPRRVEIDFSWAFVQSVLSAFNNEDVKTYLNRAWKVIRGKCSIKEVEMYTYPHLCAAHMIKDVSRNLKHIKDKGLKDFCVFCFALMQNSTSIDDAKTVFGHMWTVFNTEYETEEVIQSRMILQQMVKEQRIDCLDENITTADEENKTCDDEIKLTNTGTIRQSSKFWHEFKNVITEVKSKQTKDLQQEHQKENIYYDSMCMDILLNKFIYVLPLWSGILLGNLSRYCTQSTKQVLPKEDKEELRSTNNLVENWFGVVKKDILYHKKQRLRASDFIRKQFVNIRGHLTELHIYTRRGIKRKPGESEPKEEWRGKSQKQKRKPKYYSTPRKMPTPKKKKPTAVSEQPSKKKRRHIMKVKREENIISTKMTNRKHDQIGSTERKQSDVPNKNIPSWGGQVMVNNNVIKLVNTCPVDNMLYIMYCINEDKPAIIDTLYKSRDSVCMTLLNVLHLCKEEKWVEAKVIWLEKFCGFTLASEEPWDVYGSEYVHFVKHLSGIQSSFQESVCSQSNCIRKVRRIIAKDISLS